MSLRVSLALVVCAVGLMGASDARQQAAWLGHEAAKAERSGNTARAYVLYTQAFALDPTNLAYRLRVHALQAAVSHDPTLSETAAEIRKEPQPEPPADDSLFRALTPQDAAEARQPLPPTELKAAPGVRDFDIRGDGKSLFEQVARAFNLLVVFDSEYQPARQIRLQLEQADYRTALRTLEEATGSFVTPVADRLIFIASDTPAKRTQFEKTAAVAIPIPETVTTQELQEVATAVRATMDIRQLLVDNANHIFLLRDRVSKVRPAQMLVESLMHPHPQVEIEVDLLTTGDTSSTTWGLSLPANFPLVDFGRISKSITTAAIPSGFLNFLAFGGGATFIGIGITNAQLFAVATKSTTRSVFAARLVASQGQPATLHVGQKYPLVTSTFIGTIAGTSTPPPTIQFEDLGLSVKMTPHIHGMDEVSLEVEAEYKLLGATNANGVPAIENRKYQSVVRLRTGEWAVVTGLLTRSEAESLSGIAGLASVPVLGNMLSKNDKQRDRTETLVVIKTRLTNVPPTEYPAPALLTGTETKTLSLL